MPYHKPATSNQKPKTWGGAVAVLLLGAAVLVASGAGIGLHPNGKTQCSQWGTREVEPYPISAHELIETLETTSEYRVDEIPGDVRGIAIVGVTIVETGVDAETVVHESVHHMQFSSEGLLRYGARYINDLALGLYRGCSLKDSYLAVRYEIQAREAVEWLQPWVLEAVENSKIKKQWIGAATVERERHGREGGREGQVGGRTYSGAGRQPGTGSGAGVR